MPRCLGISWRGKTRGPPSGTPMGPGGAPEDALCNGVSLENVARLEPSEKRLQTQAKNKHVRSVEKNLSNVVYLCSCTCM